MKKKIIILSGIGDALLSDSSKKKIRNNDVFLDKIQQAVNYLKANEFVNGFVDFKYPTDSNKDVNVFKELPSTQHIVVNIHGDSLCSKDNELIITSLDGDKLSFNGTEFTFWFRPEEYEVCFLGIDLHGIFNRSIPQLLDQNYTVKLFSDVTSLLPETRKSMNQLSKNNNFQFCSYKSV